MRTMPRPVCQMIPTAYKCSSTLAWYELHCEPGANLTCTPLLPEDTIVGPGVGGGETCSPSPLNKLCPTLDLILTEGSFCFSHICGDDILSQIKFLAHDVSMINEDLNGQSLAPIIHSQIGLFLVHHRTLSWYWFICH